MSVLESLRRAAQVKPFALFVVSPKGFEELRGAGLDAVPAFTEQGFRSVAVDGIPVICGPNLAGDGTIEIEKEIIDILANNQQEKE